ncbi:phenylacetate--CoA ligase family protein [Flagellimonas crocea]|uniref:CoF synthetase n=1 Tax=Flagellimonas crocea TaxID=3067311 RepID=UPI00296F4FCD|nr:CoF synthetase [Muricauda sp. DH64]
MAKLTEQLRNLVFWSVDMFKGGDIRKHYNEIKKVQNNPSSEFSEQIRAENLAKLLQHAVNTVPYYYDLGPDSLDLDRFPIIDKQTVRDRFEQFKSLNYRDKHNHEVMTSGSTGNPFKILHDPNKRLRNTADTLFFAQRAGYQIGSRLYYLRLWDKQYKKNKFLSKVQNIAMYSVDELTDDNVKKLIEELETDGSNKSLLAYSSALDTICAYFERNDKNKINVPIDSIIAIAESLNDEVRKKVTKYLGTEPISRYSNSENGILAQQEKNGGIVKRFEINWASYHIEILDLNNDEPVALGTPGRIVITDLFNYSMPMIRYDTGDVGVMEQDSDTGELFFSRIDGRKMDMFTNTKGEYISSHIIHHILQFKGIEQFQFIEEESGEYLIKLKVSNSFDKSEDEEGIRKKYQEYFGDDAIIKINYVDNIPLLQSGKRKLVINNNIHKKQKYVAHKNVEGRINIASITKLP